jgi:valyl-tRNA synthetase
MVADLEEQGYLEKHEEHMHSVGHCYRCKTMVEPILSKQWFVKVGPLAEEAVRTVDEGRTRIVPEVWNKTFYEWMNNIRDWCISRQIWWGHRIPAWYCECGEVIVARQDPTACPACGSKNLRRETDVLDTWFSSGLWPFSTMGWPDKTDLLEKFYPTSCLVTGFDILFFWVARMMMMGNKFMGEVPFKDVCIHALVRDAKGQKMSKSKGNVMDPLLIMDEYGTDAFRFTLAAFAAQGRDIKMSEDRIAGYRNFVNKVWNAARFTLMHLSEDMEEGANLEPLLEDRWILSRSAKAARDAGKAIEEYRFNDAASAIYQFTWHEFCDWYLEFIKPQLYNADDPARQAKTRRVLREVFSRLIRMLHPFMPFITEELWQRLPGSEGSIMKSDWPLVSDEDQDLEAEEEMKIVMEVIGAVRNIRGEMGVNPGQQVPLLLKPADKETQELLERNTDRIALQTKAQEVRLEMDGEQTATMATTALSKLTVLVDLKDLVDFKAEEARLGKKIAKLEKEIAKSDKKLSNQGFVDKAPQEVIQKEKDKLEKGRAQVERLKDNLSRVRSFL